MKKSKFATLKPRIASANLSRLATPAAREGAFGNSSTAHLRLTGRASQARRLRIALRDMYTCRLCGRATDLCDGEADHIVNLAASGRADDGDDSGLQWLCVDCHEIKSQAEAQAGR